VSLQIEVSERSGIRAVSEPKHVRRIVVEHAPALFVVPCGDPQCRDGGHDLTHIVMRALSARRTVFEGDNDCSGSLGSASCSRSLRYRAVAEYRDRVGAKASNPDG
jgi:hypothetical protein